jgi:hypothetical protein
MSKGKVVTQVPMKSISRRVNDKYDWDKHATEARKVHPKSLLAEESVPMSNINSVRGFRTEPFSNKDGSIKVFMRNSKVDDAGVRRGDVYLLWVPNETKEITDAPTHSG